MPTYNSATLRKLPLEDAIERVLLDAPSIQARIRQLGAEIANTYRGQDLLLISVLKGSIIFMADLIRAIDIPHEIDFMATSSYGAGTRTSGVVRILKDLNKSIEGRNVLIVEDIIDSGHTLDYLVRILQERQPATLRIVTLLDKPDRREVETHVDWVGFSIPNDFVVGYGLDYNEIYRNLPYIGVLKPEIYSAPPAAATTEQRSAKDAKACRCLLWALLLGVWLGIFAFNAALAQSDSEPRSYTVVAGDTLFEIAQRFGVTLEELVAFNGITNPNLLEVGQVLLIPAPGAAGNPTGSLPAANVSVVRARPGETVAALAARYALTVEQVTTLNAIDAAARLFPGQPLLIPSEAVGSEPLRFGAIRTVTVPPQLVQGRTGSVTVETTLPRQLGGNWNGLPLTFLPLPDTPNRYFAYLPVPALIAPASYWLTVAYTASNGVELSQSWMVAVAEGPYDSQEINLPDDRGGLLAPDIVQPEFEKVAAVWSQRTPTLYWSEAFSRPISSEYPTTSPFGTRRSYNGGPYASYHEGQDFGVPAGVPVMAPGAGVVALAETLNVRGNAVIIDHGGGVFSGYWHLSELKVTPGQTVSTGDVLGLSGNTGLSTGAHLHWELRIYGIAIDPLQFLERPLIAPQ